ncbi:MAG: type I methionyl aminopeptidase [Candidatus Sumerlaeaceae bacterium]|nr:type I methionyl aminopeptidase [Candidatus Sumerlaeaceae bacterium]
MIQSSRIEIKSPKEIQRMSAAGKLLRAVFLELEKAIQPGITTGELDQLARRLIEDAGAIPAFLGYQGYPATLCTSVNEEIVHGIPGRRVLRMGDIVAIDCGLILGGFYADSAYTYPVGDVTPVAARLIEVTRCALNAGINEMRPDNRLGTLSAAIQKVVEDAGFSVVREYTGHGIGRALHEPPQVLNFGTPGTGLRLRPGMVFAIEPMVNVGTWKTRVLDDDWTVVTADGSLSAHFEHTVAVTENGPLVLTA